MDKVEVNLTHLDDVYENYVIAKETFENEASSQLELFENSTSYFAGNRSDVVRKQIKKHYESGDGFLIKNHFTTMVEAYGFTKKELISLRADCESLGEPYGVSGDSSFTDRKFMYDADNSMRLYSNLHDISDQASTIANQLKNVSAKVSSIIGKDYSEEIDSDLLNLKRADRYAANIMEFTSRVSRTVNEIKLEFGKEMNPKSLEEDSYQYTKTNFETAVLADIDSSDKDMQKAISLLEQADFLKQHLSNESEPNTRNQLLQQINALHSQIDTIITKHVASMKHGEEFGNVYGYLKTLGYSIENQIQLVCYWESVDDNDSLQGIEMPQWWCEEHLTPLKELVVTQDNYEELFYSDKLRDWYYQGYFLIDSISGQPTTSERLDADYVYDTSMALMNTMAPIYDAYERWFDYSYGAMVEYCKHENTIRATKYALDTHLGMGDLRLVNGVYHVYSNVDDALYEFAVDAYLSKNGHADHFYNSFMTDFDANLNKVKLERENQLMEYIRFDIKEGRIIELSDKERQMLEIERNSTSFTDFKMVDFLTAENLAFQLEHNMYGVGNRTVKVDYEKNAILI
ncbi:MAG: hypothetical protein MJ123_12225, partial [Lachnospiraceae bacterium]|nr:hypothetical protein [Lachnospiraceae bacterium]